jgi:hypothetical protein
MRQRRNPLRIGDRGASADYCVARGRGAGFGSRRAPPDGLQADLQDSDSGVAIVGPASAGQSTSRNANRHRSGPVSEFGEALNKRPRRGGAFHRSLQTRISCACGGRLRVRPSRDQEARMLLVQAQEQGRS